MARLAALGGPAIPGGKAGPLGAHPSPRVLEPAADFTALGPAGTVVVVAHSNTIRSLMAYFDEVGEEEIPHLHVPNSVPIQYRFERHSQKILSTKLQSAAGGSHARWLLSPENHASIRKAILPGGLLTRAVIDSWDLDDCGRPGAYGGRRGSRHRWRGRPAERRRPDGARSDLRRGGRRLLRGAADLVLIVMLSTHSEKVLCARCVRSVRCLVRCMVYCVSSRVAPLPLSVRGTGVSKEGSII